MTATGRFRAVLMRVPGPGSWVFAKIPKKYAPPVTHGWGRTPVTATVDDHTWDTSVWADKKHGCLLPVPRRWRDGKDHGDHVRVRLAPRDPGPANPR